jgi:hypothetical protein
MSSFELKQEKPGMMKETEPRLYDFSLKTQAEKALRA